MKKFWAEIEVNDDEIHETEDPMLFDVDAGALPTLTNGATKIRFKVLRFVEGEPREESK